MARRLTLEKSMRNGAACAIRSEIVSLIEDVSTPICAMCGMRLRQCRDIGSTSIAGYPRLLKNNCFVFKLIYRSLGIIPLIFFICFFRLDDRVRHVDAARIPLIVVGLHSG